MQGHDEGLDCLFGGGFELVFIFGVIEQILLLLFLVLVLVLVLYGS